MQPIKLCCSLEELRYLSLLCDTYNVTYSLVVFLYYVDAYLNYVKVLNQNLVEELAETSRGKEVKDYFTKFNSPRQRGVLIFFHLNHFGIIKSKDITLRLNNDTMEKLLITPACPCHFVR